MQHAITVFKGDILIRHAIYVNKREESLAAETALSTLKITFKTLKIRSRTKIQFLDSGYYFLASRIIKTNISCCNSNSGKEHITALCYAHKKILEDTSNKIEPSLH